MANRAFLIARHQSLQTVADWTGGRAILNTNAPEKSVRPILEESSAYYLLAFQASDVKSDGKFHPITVKVNRPDVQVRTRKGYYADAITRADRVADTSVSLEAIARELLPERGLPMSVTAAPFRGPDGKAVVVITTGVRGRTTVSAGASTDTPGASPLEPVEILTSVFVDGQKTVEWQRQQFSAALPYEVPNELRYESFSTLALAPGTYEVRVATRQERAAVAGSVHTYVDVPDFDGGALTLSGLVLLDRRAPTTTPLDSLSGLLDTAPTTRREFRADRRRLGVRPRLSDGQSTADGRHGSVPRPGRRPERSLVDPGPFDGRTVRNRWIRRRELQTAARHADAGVIRPATGRLRRQRHRAARPALQREMSRALPVPLK